MPPMPLEEPRDPQSPKSFALFALGFRPFFLAAGVSASLLVPIWLLLFQSGGQVSGYFSAQDWHRHEMIFGFGMAVVAGFLLTAAGNWTNQPTPRGKPLLLLSLLWLAGRLLPLLDVSHWLIASVDLAFAPLIAFLLARPILRAKQHLNLVFPGLILLISLGNLLIHLQWNGLAQDTAGSGIYLGLLSLVWIMAIMGGRVIPFFIERGLGGGFTARKWPWLEKAVFIVLGLLIVATVAGAPTELQGGLALLAALLHGIRVAGWHHPGLWRVPLLWVLWLGYAWLVVGFLLQGLASFGLFSPSLALHGFAAGALGTLAMGMMARVSLGHSGRQMQLTSPLMVWAFVAVNVAGLLRVILPLALPVFAPAAIVLAGITWTLAFLIFTWIYLPILSRPRVDGRPG